MRSNLRDAKNSSTFVSSFLIPVWCIHINAASCNSVVLRVPIAAILVCLSGKQLALVCPVQCGKVLRLSKRIFHAYVLNTFSCTALSFDTLLFL